MLFFTLETLADTTAIDLLEPPSAPSNYKDTHKIREYIMKSREAQIEKMPLDNDTGKIRSISWMEMDSYSELVSDAHITTVIVDEDDLSSERDCLFDFWKVYITNGMRSIGWGNRKFALPYLQKRSFALNLTIGDITTIPDLNPYHTANLDLSDYFNHDLKWVAKRYGIVGEERFQDITGKNLMEQITSFQDLREYSKDKLWLIYRIYARANGIYF